MNDSLTKAKVKWLDDGRIAVWYANGTNIIKLHVGTYDNWGGKR